MAGFQAQEPGSAKRCGKGVQAQLARQREEEKAGSRGCWVLRSCVEEGVHRQVEGAHRQAGEMGKWEMECTVSTDKRKKCTGKWNQHRDKEGQGEKGYRGKGYTGVHGEAGGGVHG